MDHITWTFNREKIVLRDIKGGGGQFHISFLNIVDNPQVILNFLSSPYTFHPLYQKIEASIKMSIIFYIKSPFQKIEKKEKFKFTL